MPRKRPDLGYRTRKTRMKKLKRRIIHEMMINYHTSQVYNFGFNPYPDNIVKTEPVVEYGTSSMLQIKQEKDAQDEYKDAISEAEVHGTLEAPSAARLDTENYKNAFDGIVEFKAEDS